MSQLNDGYLNPFDDDNQPFTVLHNQRQQYSLWPGFAATPAGWHCCFGPASREQCLTYVQQHWPHIQPFLNPAAGPHTAMDA